MSRTIHSIWSMARIGEFRSNNLYSVRVYSGEGPVPHFHVINTQNNTETCVRIDCAEYFTHGTKIFEFNSKQKRSLNEFLHSTSPYEEDEGKLYYELVWAEWNRNNPEHRIPKPSSIPNYNELN